MNFYGWNIGDYSSATAHLTWDEDLAYRRLLDTYYQRELPLPEDFRAIYRLVRANEDRQREAIRTIIKEFFVLESDGWHNIRADEEIAKTRLKKAKAKGSAHTRWDRQKYKILGQGELYEQNDANASVSDANAMRSHGNSMRRNRDPRSSKNGNANASKDDANASDDPCERITSGCEGNAPNPNPNIREEKKGLPAKVDDGALLETRLRQAAGWEKEISPNLAVTGVIEELLKAGCDLEKDVLPTVRAKAERCRYRASWAFFVDDIKRARDLRLSAHDPLPPSTRTGGSNGRHETLQRTGYNGHKGSGIRDALNAIKREIGDDDEQAGRG